MNEELDTEPSPPVDSPAAEPAEPPPEAAAEPLGNDEPTPAFADLPVVNGRTFKATHEHVAENGAVEQVVVEGDIVTFPDGFEVARADLKGSLRRILPGA